MGEAYTEGRAVEKIFRRTCGGVTASSFGRRASGSGSLGGGVCFVWKYLVKS